MLRGSVSPDPSKIPYGGFSPVRLQGSTTALFFRAHPSSRASLMRPQCSPSLHGGGLPLSRHAEHVGAAPAPLTTPPPPPSIGLRPWGRGSAARYPTTRFSWEAISALHMVFALAAAPSFARPPDGSGLSAPRRSAL